MSEEGNQSTGSPGEGAVEKATLDRRTFIKRTAVGATVTAATALGGLRWVPAAAAVGSDDTPDARAIAGAKALLAKKSVSQLTVLEPSGSLGDIVPVAKEWTRLTGVEIKYIEVPLLEIAQRVLQEAVARTGTWDLALPASFGLPDIAESGVIVDLTEFAEKYKLDGGTAGCQMLYPIANYYRGRLYGLGTDGDTYMMFYRKDLLDDPQEQKSFEREYGHRLAVPETWEELDSQVKFFYRPNKNFYGGALFRSRGFIAWEWNIRFHGKGRWLFDDNMKPQINSEEGIKAAAEMIAITKYLDPGARSNGLFENFEAYGAGRSYCNIGWGGSQKYFWDPTKSKVYGKLTWGMAPGGAVRGKKFYAPYFNWGWNYVVNRNSRAPELAYLFAQFAYSPRMSTEAVRFRGGYFDPFRTCHYTDPVIRQIYGDGFLKVHKESMTHNFPDLYLKGHGEYWDVLDANLQSADVGKKTPKQALDETAATWEKITNRVGRDRQVAQWKFLKAHYPPELAKILA
jgi:multiple sugar transport system substrate-binding protein